MSSGGDSDGGGGQGGGGSWVLQGCLFGAVGLFVVLLLLMIFLAFRRFQENAEPSDGITPAALVGWEAADPSVDG